MTDVDVTTLSALRGRLDRRMLLGVGAAGALAFTFGRQGQAHAAPGSAGSNGWASGVRIRFFVGGNEGDAFGSIVFNGARQAEADLGATVDYIFSAWNVGRMTDQLREAIAARPDGIAMMGHPGDDALLPLAEQAHEAGILMMYQNVDLPRVRAAFGGGYIGADVAGQGAALATLALKSFNLQPGDPAIVFGSWGEPGRFIREEATAKTFEQAGLTVDRVVTTPESASDPNSMTPVVTAAFLRNPGAKLISYNGGQTLSAAPNYMQALGKAPGEVFNIGFDLSPAIIDAVAGGWVQITADQQPFLQGYLPILSLCLSKKYAMAPLSYDTGAGFVTRDNYQPLAELARVGIR